MTPARVRVTLLGIAAVVAVACSNPTAPSGPGVSVSIGLQHPMTMSAVLRTTLGPRVVELTLVSSSSAAREVRAPSEGTLPVSVVLLAAAGDTLGAVAFSHDFMRGADHWVVAYVGRNRDRFFCEGEYVVTPMRDTSGDTLFVRHGSLPHGAVC